MHFLKSKKSGMDLFFSGFFFQLLRLISALRTQIPTKFPTNSGIIISNSIYHSEIILLFLLAVLIYTSKNYCFNSSYYCTSMDMHV